MREKIIEKANDLFLNFGFKSITMDDLASEMGISKKTIYTHFQNKTKLVEATTDHTFCAIRTGIDTILEEKREPIEELFTIKAFVINHLKNEKASPQYQLQKYYPKIYATLKKKQFEVMQDCVIENLNRGIANGVFLKHINIEFISRIYFMGMNSIKDQDMFPNKQFEVAELQQNYLEYHIRGIATNKGLQILDNLLKTFR
ncbi:TetR/AcrR family transcriptional regulator [Aquimarina sp. ERC-38]|uniref:TetR/AcrR family transcriptional regulator n=1 Tax=Aquimarina sp. ERC-38 TaxID=2949996 RepID=UPI002247CCF7|nr:TetR/AcrR family transcriptional regulator [Aquimarina sp. ERC-38]UZO81306.1 TetR/AcrR family transcriptional regulator [Aquimarina sp. ERC-38]